MIRNIDKNIEFISSHQVAWFQGNGGKSFCAGGDVKVLF
jgi:enoyl-CoA hydratase/carnithine racemase